MQNLNYVEIFDKASALMVDVDYESAKKNYKLKVQEEEIFKLYFEELILNTKVNLQGHNRSMYDGKTIKEIKATFEYEYLTERYLDQIKFIITHDLFIPILEQKTELSNDSDHSVRDKILDLFKDTLTSPYFPVEHNCSVCGVNTRSYYHNGEFTNIMDSKSRVSKFASHQPCTHKDGLGEYSFKISIPSGKLVMANDLRKLFSRETSLDLLDKYIIDKSGYYNSICSELGRYYNQEFWNTLGLVYVTLDNCSPFVFQDGVSKKITVKKDLIYSPQDNYNDNDDVEYDEDNDPNYIKNYLDTEVKLGRIVTDLWAVCAIDAELMKKLSIEQDVDYNSIVKESIIIDVEPGEYVVRSFYDVPNNNQVYLEIVKL